MKWIDRLSADGTVVAFGAAAGAFFGIGTSVILAGHFPDVPLKALLLGSMAASWTIVLATYSMISAIVVRRGSFPAGTSMYMGQTALSALFLSLQTCLAFQVFRPELVFVTGSLILFAQLIVTTRLLTYILGKHDESSLLAGIGAIGAIVVFNNYDRLPFIGIERVLLETWREFSILTLCHPLFFVLQQVLKSFQEKGSEKPTNPFRSLSRTERTFYTIHLGAAALQIVAILILFASFPASTWIGSEVLWAGVSFCVLPGFYWAIQLWRLRPTHKVEKAQNSSWIGMKTAVLLIDHDPHEECRLHLPALLYRARQLQCEQIIQRTFTKSILSQSSAGSQVSLALDPRATASPCVEALTIMSVIYIDGMTLVEKRLKSLVNLLPLLDPEMASSLNGGELESLFSRLQGFFHLDYSWIDQSRDENKSQLDIRLEHLNARQRQRVLMQLSNSQWLGNFIWVSEAAREQIKIESPYLLNAIERLPIKIEHQSGRIIEAAIFLIKYENLIPRLQHYYNFDEIRARLAPLPMQAETANFVQSLDADLKEALSFHAYQKLLVEIRAFEWVGFQAKDQALDMVLRTISYATAQESHGKIREQDGLELKALARKVIHDIGYPSQEFHIEHLHKIELRQIHELQKICLDRSELRFEEAWLILASLPTKSMDLSQAHKILTIIKSACMNADLKSDSFIIGKCVETFFSLARILPESHESEIIQNLNLLANILATDRWEPEMLVSFLDKKVSLDQFKGHSLHLYDDVRNAWEKMAQAHKDEHPMGMALTLMSRWASLQEMTKAAS